MAGFQASEGEFEGQIKGPGSNVKPLSKYERFGETIRYMTWEEWLRFLDSIDNYEHKLMMRTVYELGCRVGEFVRIRLEHMDFRRGRVFFPRENTKTKRRRVSHLPLGLVNELKSWLKGNGRMSVRAEKVLRGREFLFSPARNYRQRYSENRLRQIFRKYLKRAGLDRCYGEDSWGRRLHELTIHSLRHSHIMHYIHVHRLPIAVVQKQVGHTSLKTTSVYLNPSEEAVAQAYRQAQGKMAPEHHNS
jgi:integrase/recombinase XerD